MRNDWTEICCGDEEAMTTQVKTQAYLISSVVLGMANICCGITGVDFIVT